MGIFTDIEGVVGEETCMSVKKPVMSLRRRSRSNEKSDILCNALFIGCVGKNRSRGIRVDTWIMGHPPKHTEKQPNNTCVLFTPAGADNSRLDHTGTSGARNAPFTAPTAFFTDAVMSVKSVQPYCRLGLGALKTTFFTDAAWF